VARTQPGQIFAPPSLVQIQTRITPITDTNTSSTAYTGYDCEEMNPSGGANWSRLCPCLVNVTITAKPSFEPTAIPSLLAALNTIYIRGVVNGYSMLSATTPRQLILNYCNVLLILCPCLFIIYMLHDNKGSSLSQLQVSCGIGNFVDLFRTALTAVFDLEPNEVGDISVFELNVAGDVGIYTIILEVYII
jgi:hypothetical protein